MADFYLIDGVNPEPWESPTAMVGRAKGGKLFARLVTPPGQRQFQDDFRKAFDETYPDVMPTYDPVSLGLYFWRQLPTWEGDSGKVNAHIADVTNLQKATEDCLQKRLFINDNQVKFVESMIVEQTPETTPGILIVMHIAPSMSIDWLVCAVDTIREERVTITRTLKDNLNDREVPF